MSRVFSVFAGGFAIGMGCGVVVGVLTAAILSAQRLARLRGGLARLVLRRRPQVKFEVLQQ